MKNAPTRKDLAIDTLRLLGLTFVSIVLFMIVVPLILAVLILWPLHKLFDILTGLTPWCMDDQPLGYVKRFLYSLKCTIFYKEWKKSFEVEEE